MKNKRYIRLAKKMTAKCNGRCDSGKCKFYRNCYSGRILFPHAMSIRELSNCLKDQILFWR
ncbi:hypothetical protein [Clostridium sp. M14]|uniref:hypothetical protein n=1 Tax=Clostridium sp. M14 TaxID=2716311 RepID=UPI0013EE598D|nr:hypothetical protein [Clostridium sp. M14]MBZ9693236.1 hypothetical protein [Clostridium sp. M14]